MQIEIHPAHGEAILSRTQLMQQMVAQFNLLRMEDKRHVDAVLKTLGQEPDDYAEYDLKVEKDHYYLDLQKKPEAPPPNVPAQNVPAQNVPAQQPVNGAPQPLLD